MRYYLIAGEASGDMHASNLIRAIKINDIHSEFRCFGGDMMKEAGAVLFLHYRDMALMGGIEVLRKYPVIRRNKMLCRKDILHYRPDVLILTDYSGFNLPMARFAARNKIRVIYYISPKLWAWAKWRVKTIRNDVEKMFVILPFEVDFYKKYDVHAEYYGNPVLDSIASFESQYTSDPEFYIQNGLDNKPIIALLAGSRKQEIQLLLPEMLAIMPYYNEYQFVVAGAPSISPSYYEKYLKGTGAHIVYNQTYVLLKHAKAALVASGTATLETALLRTPEVVIYKTSPVTLFIGRLFVNVKFFSLVNLIFDEEVVKEFFQNHLQRDMKNELDRILSDTLYRNKMLGNFDLLEKKLGEPGVAFRVAQRIHQILTE